MKIILTTLSLTLAVVPLIAADGPRAMVAHRTSGGDLSVAIGDAYALNLDVKAPIALRISYSEMFTVEHNTVRFAQRTDSGEWQTASTYSGDGDVLAIESGTAGRQLLVLDGVGLKLVDFAAEKATVVTTFAMQNLTLPPGGHYVDRFAGYAYVVDSTLPGMRVLSLQEPDKISELTAFRSDAVPTEVRSRGDGMVYLVSAARVTVVAIRGTEKAEAVQAGVIAGSRLAFDADARAFLADGNNVRVVDADPDAPSFLKVESSTAMPARVDRLVIENEKAFVFDAAGGLEVLSAPRRVEASPRQTQAQ